MEVQRDRSAVDIADALSGFAENLTFDAIPGKVRERARHLILDAVGVAHASTGFEFAHRALTALAVFGPGDSDVIGLPARLALRDAVLMNGILVHGIDYDDTYLPGGLHVTSSCFPCALAMAAHAGAGGRDLLTAYVLGAEVACRISAVAKGDFHQLGFHPTGEIAAFGCALLAGKLLGMNAAQLTMAQGIALSTAPISSRQYNQSAAWSKRVHPGSAGAAGITSAVLAQQGFVGAREVYEGRYGLFRMHLGQRAAQCDYGLLAGDLGQRWEIDQVAVKPYPIGQMGVGCLECAIELAREHRIPPREVRSVRARVPKETIPIMCEPVEFRRRPPTGYAAQFSLHYAIACGYVRGRFGLAELEPPALTDPEILGLCDKIECEADPDSQYPKRYEGELILTTRDGREFGHRKDVILGAGERPLTPAEMSAKFMDNAQRVMSRARAEKIHDFVLHVDRAPDAKAFSRGLAADAGRGGTR